MQYQPLNKTFQNDLTPGEVVLWTGQPNGGVIFHPQDFYLIPFSLLWGGFAIFWESGVLGYWGSPHGAGGDPFNWFMVLWGIPFVLAGQYFIWGRFVFDWWRKKRTFYAVTQKRLLIVEEVRNRKLTSVGLTENTFLDKSTRGDGIGTLRFGVPQVNPNPNRFSFGNLDSDGRPSFRDIDDVERVYTMIFNSQARLKSRTSE
jgi:hypothetical protein